MIKLIRTDTTLDLSQKAEKSCFFIGTRLHFIDNSLENNARLVKFIIKPVVSVRVVGFHLKMDARLRDARPKGGKGSQREAKGGKGRQGEATGAGRKAGDGRQREAKIGEGKRRREEAKGG